MSGAKTYYDTPPPSPFQGPFIPPIPANKQGKGQSQSNAANWQVSVLTEMASKPNWKEWPYREIGATGRYLIVVPDNYGAPFRDAGQAVVVADLRPGKKDTTTLGGTAATTSTLEIRYIVPIPTAAGKASTILDQAEARFSPNWAAAEGYGATDVPLWGTAIHLNNKDWVSAAVSFADDVNTVLLVYGGAKVLLAAGKQTLRER